MNSDIDLTAIYPPADGVTTSRLQYICNFAYGFYNSFNTVRNTKFPGTMVVALTRDDMPKLRGFEFIHAPYDPKDLLAWLAPRPIQIPTLRAMPRAKPSIRYTGVHRAKRSNIDVFTLDFGYEDGLFYVMEKRYYKVMDVHHDLALINDPPYTPT